MESDALIFGGHVALDVSDVARNGAESLFDLRVDRFECDLLCHVRIILLTDVCNAK